MHSAAQAFEPVHATNAEQERDYRVARVLLDLAQAANGGHAARALSNAMESVDAHCRRVVSPPISAAQCDELLAMIVRAQIAVVERGPEWCTADMIDGGMQALAGQVILWAETPERTAQRCSHAVSDIHAFARMHRNDLHNISLRQEVEHRAWQRRNAKIQELLAAAQFGESI